MVVDLRDRTSSALALCALCALRCSRAPGPSFPLSYSLDDSLFVLPYRYQWYDLSISWKSVWQRDCTVRTCGSLQTMSRNASRTIRRLACCKPCRSFRGSITNLLCGAAHHAIPINDLRCATCRSGVDLAQLPLYAHRVASHYQISTTVLKLSGMCARPVLPDHLRDTSL